MFIVTCIWCGNELTLDEFAQSSPHFPVCDSCARKAVDNYAQ